MLQLSRPIAPPARPTDDLRISGVTFDTGSVRIALANRRAFDLDLHRYPPLLRASFEQRLGWVLVDGGHGLAWPELGLGTRAVEGLINSRQLVRQAATPRLVGAPAVGVA
ncbi:DUF2442 domain-containing protein [Rhizobacter fulvus]|jgi:hypothetical protein